MSKPFSNFNPGEWYSRSSENEEYFICEFRCEENSSKSLLFRSDCLFYVDVFIFDDRDRVVSFAIVDFVPSKNTQSGLVQVKNGLFLMEIIGIVL